MSPPLTNPTAPMLAAAKLPSPLFTLLVLLFLCILGFFYTLHPLHPTPDLRSPQSALRYRNLFLSSSSNSTVASYLRALTLHPHLAGTPASVDTANYVHSHFKSLGLDTRKVEYEVLLSYPTHSSLIAHFSDGGAVDLSLTESSGKVVPPYHAYSPSGTAHAEVVFVNHGRDEDYRSLEALGVNVSGCVVLARKGGGLSRAGVVKIAENKGALAVLLYVERDTLRGGRRGSAERGTVMRGVGDPLTPGWAAVEGGERLGLEHGEVRDRFPKIPSMPLSEENADVIISSLGGPMAPLNWRDSGQSKVQQVGPGPTIVNLTYQGEKKLVTIHNVFASIRGLEEPDRYVLLGNHRDAWTYGAVDPNSGTAALLDISRRYALLIQKGWKPRRTIILCSWDAEEFGMVGSTEWVEQNLVNLGAKAVAYLNVDCAVQGPGFFAGATPQLDDLLLEVTKKVEDPNSVGTTIYEKWTATNEVFGIQRLSGVDSDFAPFLHHAGVPCVDIYYGQDFPVYHTAFDSYDWIKNYADPLFHHQVAVAGVWGLLALHLADDYILPFNYLSYADQLERHKKDLSNFVEGSISIHSLAVAIQGFAAAAKEAENEAELLRKQESRGEFVALKMRALNDRLMLAERGFLHDNGLKGRQWFKHLIYGPPSDYESKLNFFPGVADAISQSKGMNEQDQLVAIQHEIWKVARAIERGAAALKGQLT